MPASSPGRHRVSPAEGALRDRTPAAPGAPRPGGRRAGLSGAPLLHDAPPGRVEVQPSIEAIRSSRSRNPWTSSVSGSPRRLAVGDVGDRDEVQAFGPGAAAQDLGGGRDDRIEPEVRIARLERAGEVARPDLARRARRRASRVRIGPAQPHGREHVLAADVLAQPERVQRGHGVPGTDRAGVDLVVGEIVVADVPVLVADEAVRGDDVAIELDLRPRIERDRLQRAGQVLGEQPAGLVEDVHVGVEAVALVGELLEQRVVVVAHPDADRDELDARLGVAADRVEDRFGVGQADVGDAVGGEHDPVDAVLGQGLAGEVVAEPQAGLEVRGAARPKLLDDPEDLVASGRPGRLRAGRGPRRRT